MGERAFAPHSSGIVIVVFRNTSQFLYRGLILVARQAAATLTVMRTHTPVEYAFSLRISRVANPFARPDAGLQHTAENRNVEVVDDPEL